MVTERGPIRATWALGLVSALLGAPGLALAQEPDDTPDFTSLKTAVVSLIAKGTLTSQGNAPVATHGTGFFISKNGYLLTSHHLRTELGAVDEGTVSYEVHFSATSADFLYASEVWTSKTHDLMVLFASIEDRPVSVLKKGQKDGIVPGSTPVFTVGYPEGWHFSVDRGFIKSFWLIDPIPAWSTSLLFKGGQSGSPICLKDRRVVATARGNDADAPSIGVIVPVRIVPSEYWDSPGP